MWRAVSFDDNITFEKGELVVIEKVEGAHVVIKQVERQKKNEQNDSTESKDMDNGERNEENPTDSDSRD